MAPKAFADLPLGRWASFEAALESPVVCRRAAREPIGGGPPTGVAPR